ncbi:uncharacterized protein si:dkey-112e17.1 [Megalops cyprinoides]|uniref:uncharacterized protein si:dkey-112e17.1 n=1 Tax=Megalops cyprinoides TaxID=118141 RepID=UPI00186534B4|nr:uncharacterized protein si:dkey-112e17.1 [Megalops cyprinoides]
MEMFDFDVFESHDNIARYAVTPEVNMEGIVYDGATPTLRSTAIVDYMESPKGPTHQAQGGTMKAPQASQKDEAKQVVVQEQSTKMEMAKISNSAKWSADLLQAPPSPAPNSHPLPPGAQPLSEKKENSISSQAFRGDGDPDQRAVPSRPDSKGTPTPQPAMNTDTTSPETQQPVIDACPHDVLYISDLITFSSRFCGSNKPTGRQLVFGSQEEMVEVIMELITTTHWGRGFALLFHYHNHTDIGDQRLLTPPSSKMDALLAAVCGAAFFALVLTTVLCVIFRPKLCAKRAHACSSTSSEQQEGPQSSGVDVSELQLVAPNQAGLEVPAENDSNQRSLGLSQLHSGSSVSGGADISHNAELELSPNGLTELDLGTDEVFVISSGPSPSGLPFCPRTQRERFLRHSDTGPSPVGDWLSPDSAGALPAAGKGGQGGGTSSARPRAWSVRTFQDLLPPLPQLQRKWCSWNSTSPFTKLVDSAPASSAAECHSDGRRKIFSDTHLESKADSNQSDSSMSNASYPLAQPAQRQRRLNSISNLRRSRFTTPCFSLLSGPSESAKAPAGPLGAHPHPQASPSEPINGCLGRSPQGEVPGGSPRDFPGEGDHVSVPVFAISEEEDRQPLVMAEHLGQSPLLNGLSQEPYSRKTQASRSPSATSPVNGSLLPRGRSDWRPWGCHALGDGSVLPSDSPTDAEVRDVKSALVHNTAKQIQPSSLSQSTLPCSVAGKEM